MRLSLIPESESDLFAKYMEGIICWQLLSLQ